mgnify:CR=1 FL=1
MRVELADGRSFRFPDDTDEAQIDRFVQALLAAEKSAADAQARAADLHAVVSAQKPTEFPPDTSPAIVAAIKEMQRTLESALSRIERVAGADRILVEDEFGVSRSRKAKGIN